MANERSGITGKKEGTLLDKTLERHGGYPTRDIYGPPTGQQRPVVERENDNANVQLPKDRDE